MTKIRQISESFLARLIPILSKNLLKIGKESIFILQINNLIEIILNSSHMLTEQHLHLQVESDVIPLQF